MRSESNRFSVLLPFQDEPHRFFTVNFALFSKMYLY